MQRRGAMRILSAAWARGVDTPFSSLWTRFLLRIWGGRCGAGLAVRGRPRLHLLGVLTLGDEVRLRSGYSNYVGGHQPVAIWVGPGASMIVGDRCAISNSTFVCLKEIVLLEETFIGGGCRIYDTDFHQLAPEDRLANRGPVPAAPIRIGPRAFVGGHCTILKGVTIGEGAVIGAGSIVTRDVPAFEIWAGVPARKIRDLPRD